MVTQSVASINELLSTTTAIGRVRGFSITLLRALQEQAKRCYDLAVETEQARNYVYQYLRNLKRYGLVAKNGFFWELTRPGIDFLSYLSSININNNNNNNREQKKEKRKTKDRQKIASLSFKQVSLIVFFQNSSFHEAERQVVEVLVAHYNQTGSKALYFHDIYEMAETFKNNPDIISQVLLKLKQDRIAYVFKDQTYNAFKVGLYKAFIELLQKES